MDFQFGVRIDNGMLGRCSSRTAKLERNVSTTKNNGDLGSREAET